MTGGDLLVRREQQLVMSSMEVMFVQYSESSSSGGQ